MPSCGKRLPLHRTGTVFAPKIATCEDEASLGTSLREAAAKKKIDSQSAPTARECTNVGWVGKKHGGCGGLCPPHARTSRKRNAPLPARRMPHGGGTTRRGVASFVQRMPSDSAKRCVGATHEGRASFGTTQQRAAAKRAGGRAKTWGVWGVSPHMKSISQKRGVGARGVWGVSPHMQKPPAKKAHSSPAGHSPKKEGGCWGGYAPHIQALPKKSKCGFFRASALG